MHNQEDAIGFPFVVIIFYGRREKVTTRPRGAGARAGACVFLIKLLVFYASETRLTGEIDIRSVLIK